MEIMRFSQLDSLGIVDAGYTMRGNGMWYYRPGTEDSKDNYRTLAEKFGITCDRIVRVSQDHTGNVAVVTSKNGGDGIYRGQSIKNTDGIVTNEKNLMLSIITADCIPLYLVDAAKEVIGLAHCGRKGIENSIVQNTVYIMKDKYKCDTKDICAYIGPHICKNCYETDINTAQLFMDKLANVCKPDIVSFKKDSAFIDLGRSVVYLLLSCGVSESNIAVSDKCNYHNNEEFYSYRRNDMIDGEYCSDLAFLMLRK